MMGSSQDSIDKNQSKKSARVREPEWTKPPPLEIAISRQSLSDRVFVDELNDFKCGEGNVTNLCVCVCVCVWRTMNRSLCLGADSTLSTSAWPSKVLTLSPYHHLEAHGNDSGTSFFQVDLHFQKHFQWCI